MHIVHFNSCEPHSVAWHGLKFLSLLDAIRPFTDDCEISSLPDISNTDLLQRWLRITTERVQSSVKQPIFLQVFVYVVIGAKTPEFQRLKDFVPLVHVVSRLTMSVVKLCAYL